MKTMLFTSIIVSFVDWFLGGFDNSLYILTLLITLKCITMYFLSYSKNNLSSLFATNYLREYLILIVVGIAHLIDTHFSGGSLCRSLTLTYYIVNESICVIQNLSLLGICIPKRLLKIINIFNTKDNEDMNSKTDKK
jgi:toxin secretion/phage lysis holin